MEYKDWLSTKGRLIDYAEERKGGLGGSAADLQNIHKSKDEKVLSDRKMEDASKLISREKKETIVTIAWASCFVIGMLCFLIYGISWFSYVEVTNEDIYNRRHIAKEIEELQIEYLKLKEHVHRYYDGKIKYE